MSFLPGVSSLSPMERVKAYVALGFSLLVGVAFLVSLGCMVYFRYVDPKADIGIWLNVFLTCLGYIVGILTGLFGIPLPAAPSGGSAGGGGGAAEGTGGQQSTGGSSGSGGGGQQK